MFLNRSCDTPPPPSLVTDARPNDRLEFAARAFEDGMPILRSSTGNRRNWLVIDENGPIVAVPCVNACDPNGNVEVSLEVIDDLVCQLAVGEPRGAERS